MHWLNTKGPGTTPAWSRVAGNWEQFSGRLRERWAQLTDEDVQKIDGRREHLIGKIQERYGIITDQAERQVADWLEEVAKN
ncbi:CsbD family protein [uncultured Ferrovibrio sp.]|jgi:uncharacterized protein YjbJ (UPF0337 family)|uniref:CsbD family protein n=1 Tax=uncultured Ferrovibrio sp. TaxID=1576913 RepID=UPI002614D8ED|nr:CsbD family protein [uncultured Ferrovibrio sp.]